MTLIQDMKVSQVTGDALIQNKIVYCMTENQFRKQTKAHNNSVNDYFFIQNKFDKKHSSVAFIMTRDNFVVVGKRSHTFAWTSFVFNMSRCFKKYLNNKITYETLQKILRQDLSSKYWLFTKDEIELLRSRILENDEPVLYRCLQLFPNMYNEIYQIEAVNNSKDMILLGGHPNQDETMQMTLMREISEEGNITSCLKLCPLGTLLIYDHRFRKYFYSNLFLFYTSFTKREVQNKFKSNKEVESISFTLLTQEKVHPLEIVQNCLS